VSQVSPDRVTAELERIAERSVPDPGAFDRFERRIRRRRLRERAFAGAIAAAVVAGTALAYLQLPAARRAGGVTTPVRARVEGIYETRITPADLKAIPVDSPMFSPRDADFLRLGTGRLRLVLQGGLYQLIFYQDRRGPLYLRNAGSYVIRGDRIALRSWPSYRPTVQKGPSRIVLRWSLGHGLLRLAPISDTEPWPENRAATRTLFGAHPWHRVS
jgi:hypothetical protein